MKAIFITSIGNKKINQIMRSANLFQKGEGVIEFTIKSKINPMGKRITKNWIKNQMELLTKKFEILGYEVLEMIYVGKE